MKPANKKKLKDLIKKQVKTVENKSPEPRVQATKKPVPQAIFHSESGWDGW